MKLAAVFFGALIGLTLRTALAAKPDAVPPKPLMEVGEAFEAKYACGYYSISPRVDPTGPSQGTKSRFEYKVVAPQTGEYSITAQVVTAHYNQRLNISAGNGGSGGVLKFPFTLGKWQESQPFVLTLAKGENTPRFWRNKPPQYGLAIKHFTLTPVK